jgi:Mat/Ecp fimbriae major subunit
LKPFRCKTDPEWGDDSIRIEAIEPRGLKNMKKFALKALAASAIVATGFGATAANAATADANATAVILAPVTVTKTADLDFGTIAVGTSGATVAVSTAGARTCGTGLVCSGATSAAAFTVSGVTGQTVSVSLPGSVSLTSGANTMSATLTSSAASIVLDGTDAFTVGGTLTVSGTQAAGNYSGLFTATVNYQ